MITYVAQWFREKIVLPLHELSFIGKLVAITFGTWFGIFPIPGASTFLLILAFNVLTLRKAAFNRAQMTLAMAVNFLMTPVMFLLIPFWLGVGSFIFRLTDCSPSDIIPAFSQSFITAVMQFTGCLTSAAISWVIFTPFVLGPFYSVHKRTINAGIPEDRQPLTRLEQF